MELCSNIVKQIFDLGSHGIEYMALSHLLHRCNYRGSALENDYTR